MYSVVLYTVHMSLVYPLCFLYGAWISLHSLSWTEYPSLVGILRLCAVGIIVQELLKHFFDYSVWIITREYTLSFLVKNSFLFWSKNTLFFRSKAFLSLKHFWLTTIVWSTIILVKNFFCQKHFSVINLFFVKTVLVNTFPFFLRGGNYFMAVSTLNKTGKKMRMIHAFIYF